MTFDSKLVRRILVIKLRAIGDVLLSTVVLRNLRRAFPGAQLDVLTERPSRDVLEGNPDVSNLLIFDGRGESGLGLIRRVRSRKYDLVIDLFGNPRSALVAGCSGARYRVGFRFGWRAHCYNLVVEPRGGLVHNTQFNLDALAAIGIVPEERQPVFPVDEASEQFASSFFADQALAGEFVVALNGSGGWPTKRWPESSFAALADRIASASAVKVLIVWGPGEREGAERMAGAMQSPALVAPATTLKQLGAILRRCAVLVTNDSGPMHIAAALGTPTVAIFGPTNPHLQGPVGDRHAVVQNERLVCLGCNYTSCPIGNPCMNELTVEEVFRAYWALVGRLQPANS
jgi:predicted lipopolysaccharide heptosyltransferase III